MDSERRTFLKAAGTAVAVGAMMQAPISLLAQTPATTGKKAMPTAGPAVLPKLAYAYSALEPHIDAQTMELHHSKHHQAYVDGLNKADTELAKARSAGDFALIQHWSRSLSFNYSGHYLHSLFWSVMAPAQNGGGGDPEGELAERIKADFGGIEVFRKQFSEAAAKVEGGGWALLHYRPMDGRLVITQAESQNKLAMWGTMPILGVDVWEHAYYLKYQNRRAEYITAWWNVVNWRAVADRLNEATA